MKTVAEQIADLEASRAAKAARMGEITNKTLTDGRTKDAAESEEFNTLRDDITAIDAELTDLAALNAINATKAAPVPKIVVGAAPAANVKAASDARGGGNVICLDRKPAPGVAFARYAGLIAASKGSISDALRMAKDVYPEEKGLHGVIDMQGRIKSDIESGRLMKAAVDIGTTTDADYAAPLVNYTNMTDDFIAFMRPQTIIGQIQGLRRVPFNVRVPRQLTGGAASWVGETKPKPVTSLSLDSVTLKWKKLATIAVISQELARFSSPSAELMIRDALAAAIIQQMDSDFVNPANAGTTDVKPASITNGVTAIPSGGSTEADIRADVAAVFAPFIAANLTPVNGFWLMSATTALSLSLIYNSMGNRAFPGISMTGGTFMGLPVVVSEAVGNIVVLASASDILLADDGQMLIDSSSEASVQMDSAPASPTDATTVLVSLWQQNLLGIKVERYIDWVKGRPASVQYLSGVAWTGG